MEGVEVVAAVVAVVVVAEGVEVVAEGVEVVAAVVVVVARLSSAAEPEASEGDPAVLAVGTTAAAFTMYCSPPCSRRACSSAFMP